MIGIVKEVFIPDEYINNQIIDKMNSNKIGFKISISEKELIIIQEQNEINSNIFRDDKVIITKINDKYNIELYDEV